MLANGDSSTATWRARSQVSASKFKTIHAVHVCLQRECIISETVTLRAGIYFVVFQSSEELEEEVNSRSTIPIMSRRCMVGSGIGALQARRTEWEALPLTVTVLMGPSVDRVLVVKLQTWKTCLNFFKSLLKRLKATLGLSCQYCPYFNGGCILSENGPITNSIRLMWLHSTVSRGMGCKLSRWHGRNVRSSVPGIDDDVQSASWGSENQQIALSLRKLLLLFEMVPVHLLLLWFKARTASTNFLRKQMMNLIQLMKMKNTMGFALSKFADRLESPWRLRSKYVSPDGSLPKIKQASVLTLHALPGMAIPQWACAKVSYKFQGLAIPEACLEVRLRDLRSSLEVGLP